MATGNFIAAVYTVREFSQTATVTSDNYSTGTYVSATGKEMYNGTWAVRGVFDSPITIPAKTRYVIKLSYLSGVDTAGFQNSLVLSE